LTASTANEDVLALRAASTCRVPPELDNPVLLPDPVSPHIAAARAGARIDIAHLVACHRQLAQLADAVVVEGAGGFHVPLSPLRPAPTWPRRWACPWCWWWACGWVA
jgi:dethiobiotin synthetase